MSKDERKTLDLESIYREGNAMGFDELTCASIVGLSLLNVRKDVVKGLRKAQAFTVMSAVFATVSVYYLAHAENFWLGLVWFIALMLNVITCALDALLWNSHLEDRDAVDAAIEETKERWLANN